MYVGFFRNFLLMASFLGIGVGILYGRDPRAARSCRSSRCSCSRRHRAGRRSPELDVPLRTLRRDLLRRRAATPRRRRELHRPAADRDADDDRDGRARAAARRRSCGPMPPLRAYAIDIAGSMTGVAAFTLLSCLGVGRTVGSSSWSRCWSCSRPGPAGSPAWSARRPDRPCSVWSVRAGTCRRRGRPTSGSRCATGGPRSICVNGIPHQAMSIDRRSRWIDSFYEQVYGWFPGTRSIAS